jgi:hypothetical protein
MWGHQIDQVLIALTLSTWISHAPSIVKNGDDVKLRRAELLLARGRLERPDQQ